MQPSLWFRDRHGEPTGKKFTMFINIAINLECFWNEMRVPNRFSVVIKVLAEESSQTCDRLAVWPWAKAFIELVPALILDRGVSSL